MIEKFKRGTICYHRDQTVNYIFTFREKKTLKSEKVSSKHTKSYHDYIQEIKDSEQTVRVLNLSPKKTDFKLTFKIKEPKKKCKKSTIQKENSAMAKFGYVLDRLKVKEFEDSQLEELDKV